MAVEHNIDIDQGATWVKRLSWQDSNEQPYDLTTYTAQFSIRKKYADLEQGIAPIVELTDLAGIELDNATSNIIITLTDEQTAAIPHGTYVYDLELDDGTTVTKLLRGKAFILPEVSV